MVKYLKERANNAVVEANYGLVCERDILVKNYTYLISRYLWNRDVSIDNVSFEELLNKAKEEFVSQLHKLKEQVFRICKGSMCRENSIFLVQLNEIATYIGSLINFEVSMKDISDTEFKFRHKIVNQAECRGRVDVIDKLSAWIDSYELELYIINCFDESAVKECIKELMDNDELFDNVVQKLVEKYICKNDDAVTKEDLAKMLDSGQIDFSEEQREYLIGGMV